MIVHHVDDLAWKNAIVTGFFTPDYFPLAEAFSKNLKEHGVPHVLYNVPQKAWEQAILLKPKIVDLAMQDYPDKAIILMDIDCILRGPIRPVLDFNGDISLFMGVRFLRRFPHKRTSLRVLPSSRIIAWNPTPAAKCLVSNWSRLCEETHTDDPDNDDEQILMMAIGTTAGLSVNIIDGRYSARDPKYARPDAVIIHNSVHNAVLARGAKMRIRAFKRKLISRILGRPYPGPRRRIANDSGAVGAE